MKTPTNTFMHLEIWRQEYRDGDDAQDIAQKRVKYHGLINLAENQSMVNTDIQHGSMLAKDGKMVQGITAHHDIMLMIPSDSINDAADINASIFKGSPMDASVKDFCELYKFIIELGIRAYAIRLATAGLTAVYEESFAFIDPSDLNTVIQVTAIKNGTNEKIVSAVSVKSVFDAIYSILIFDYENIFERIMRDFGITYNDFAVPETEDGDESIDDITKQALDEMLNDDDDDDDDESIDGVTSQELEGVLDGGKRRLLDDEALKALRVPDDESARETNNDTEE